MVDTRDLKSLGSNAVPVRVRPRAIKKASLFGKLFFCSGKKSHSTWLF
jgi:hypothetical protein